MQRLARNCDVNGSRHPRRDLVIATLAATELSKNRSPVRAGLSEDSCANIHPGVRDGELPKGFTVFSLARSRYTPERVRRLAPRPENLRGNLLMQLLCSQPISRKFHRFSTVRPGPFACGDDGVRTRDLVVANHALSRLSYIPDPPARAVGVLGFEPRTSALSELRSSQLSYTPFAPETKKPNRMRFGPIQPLPMG